MKKLTKLLTTACLLSLTIVSCGSNQVKNEVKEKTCNPKFLTDTADKIFDQWSGKTMKDFIEEYGEPSFKMEAADGNYYVFCELLKEKDPDHDDKFRYVDFHVYFDYSTRQITNFKIGSSHDTYDCRCEYGK